MSRRKLSAYERAILQVRSNHQCEYCRSPENISSSPFNGEHIEPIAKGGKTSLANLANSCGGCNGHKAARTTALDSVTEQQVALFHPRNDRWKAHFQWSEDKLSIIGRTPTGRATVTTLKMNRPQLVALRRLLLRVNQHPASG